jgi:cytidine deaminase
MNDLVSDATKARESAYAPYSGYAVGAATQSSDGRIWTGANVENVSYPVGMCAERAAMAKMVNDGATELTALAVATQDGGTPCGMCLQFMLEFAQKPSEVRIFVAYGMGQVVNYTLEQLIPHGFRPSADPNNQ